MKHLKKTGVLVLESIFHLGGAEKVTHSILEGMDRQKYHPVLCTLYNPGPMGQRFIENGYPVYHDVISWKFDPRGLFRMKRIIQKEKIDIIYLINQPVTILWGFLFGKLFRIPVISVIHNTFVIKAALKLNIYRLLLPHVDSIVTVAQLQKEHLVRNERIPQHLISVIHNGIEVEKYSGGEKTENSEEIRASLGLEENANTIGIVTRLVTLKGVDIFLRAARLIYQNIPNVQFVVVGDGPEKASLTLLSQKLNIDRKVHFIGSRDDVEKILPTFDIAVLSSRTEALPMVILEYMAAGRPIVATRVGSVPELVSDGVNGFLVEKDNPKDLADKVVFLMRHKEIARKMGFESRNLVSHNFTIQSTVEKTESLIDSLVSRGSPTNMRRV